ncbi:MAG: twin transmembrane helix small protein [Micavibrio aeruginosavorus]|uniref:Twin transmembrane helix small protein n=1 Tax=Micavibrio aeruginosavorus TaxID=349221 RepID=A0A7T5R172_9BACT|nr:MAG: twin transmembrane helix small protein [Micavibrio aeruginosavorus]
MNNIFVTLMIVAMLATLGSLAMGLFAMVKGGDFNKKHGNRLMQMRVTLQGLALLFFALAFMTSK